MTAARYHARVAERSSIAYLKRYRGALGSGVAALVASNVLFLGIPYYLALAVEALQHHQGDEGQRDERLHDQALLVPHRILDLGVEFCSFGGFFPGGLPR